MVAREYGPKNGMKVNYQVLGSGEEQPFDPIDMLDPLSCHRLALTADAAAIFLLWSWCSNHGAHPRFRLVCTPAGMM